MWNATSGLGETANDVGRRAAGVVDRVLPFVESGQDVALVAHAHLLRILTAVWLELPAERGVSFALQPAGAASSVFSVREPRAARLEQLTVGVPEPPAVSPATAAAPVERPGVHSRRAVSLAKTAAPGEQAGVSQPSCSLASDDGGARTAPCR